MADTDSRCGNCKYFRDQQIMGVCRYFPQQINKHFTDWCGHHEPLQPVDAPIGVEVAKVKRKYERKVQP